jgi:hypothetical protein
MKDIALFLPLMKDFPVNQMPQNQNNFGFGGMNPGEMVPIGFD